tara:strand:- start:64 stop:678 length:615 start_codon:yes stop_codon:yes gene_type:complete
MMRFNKNLSFLGFVLLVTSSCTTPNIMYQPDYVPYSSFIAKSSQIDGKVVVVMSEAQENYIITKNPSSFSGSALSGTFNIGKMLKEITLSSYAVMFKDGSEFSNTYMDNYMVSITPTVTYFDYKFDQKKGLGFTVTPQVAIKLNLEMIDENGNKSFSKEYSSGIVSGKSYAVSGQPFEEINKVLHKVIFDVVEMTKIDLLREIN